MFPAAQCERSPSQALEHFAMAVTAPATRYLTAGLPLAPSTAVRRGKPVIETRSNAIDEEICFALACSKVVHLTRHELIAARGNILHVGRIEFVARTDTKRAL